MLSITCFATSLTLCIIIYGLPKTAACHLQLPRCPMGATPNSSRDEQVDTLFPGLFLSQDASDHLEQESFTLVKFKRIRQLQKIGSASSTGPQDYTRRLNAQKRCCERTDSLIEATKAAYKGRQYKVVQLNNKPQYLTMSECVKPNNSCDKYNRLKRCKEYYLVHFVLVWYWPAQPYYYPPVRFVPLKVKAGCECI